MGLFSFKDKPMQVTQKVDSISRRKDKTLATGTPYKLFSDASGEEPNIRQGVSIRNLDTATDLIVRYVNRGEAAGTISATASSDYIVEPEKTISFSFGMGIDVWVQHAKGTDLVLSYVELI
jgi:hypothetical protein